MEVFGGKAHKGVSLEKLYIRSCCMKNIFGTFFVKNALGRQGEDIAVSFLRRLGYVVVARNVVNPRGKRLGEIDIVVMDGDCLVFAEVKTRTSRDIPLGLSIQKEKLHRLNKIGEWYIKQADLGGRNYRFDLVGVLLFPGKKPEITHVQSIFL